jgi:lysozyme family protein
VAQLTKEEATAIYLTRYWQAVKGDQLPSGIDLYCADFAVNSGLKNAARELQALVETKPDNFIGPDTLAAVRKKDPAKLLNEYHARRMNFLLGLKQWETYSRGWTDRCNRMWALAQQKVQASPTMAEAAGSKIVASNTAVGGLSLTGIAWAANQYGPQVLEWLKDPDNIAKLQSGVTYVGNGGVPMVVSVLGGLLALSVGVNGYSIWRRLKMFRKGEV